MFVAFLFTSEATTTMREKIKSSSSTSSLDEVNTNINVNPQLYNNNNINNRLPNDQLNYQQANTNQKTFSYWWPWMKMMIQTKLNEIEWMWQKQDSSPTGGNKMYYERQICNSRNKIKNRIKESMITKRNHRIPIRFGRKRRIWSKK